MMTPAEILSVLESRAQALLQSGQGGHDWDHTLRVLNNARHLAAVMARDYGVSTDSLVIEAAVLLHDIGRPEEMADHGASDHAVIGAEMAQGILQDATDLSPERIARICECIRSHRYRRREGNLPPDTLEEQIVFDADKLDSLGAIGIGRAFHFAGHIGARVHNTAQEALASASYSHEDSCYREYLVKLRYLKGAMLTPAGRKEAEARDAFMTAFFEELSKETGL